MATVEELVRSIKGSLPLPDLGGPVVAKWIDERYKEMVSKVRFKHLRKIGELSLLAYYNTGTAAVDRGSKVVTGYDDGDGDGTAWATTPTVTPYEFWYFRNRTTWYNVSTVTDDDTLGLLSNYAEADAEYDSDEGVAVPYTLVQRYYPLAATARWLGTFVHTCTRMTLSIETPETMDVIAPGRIHIGGYPSHVSLLGRDATNGYLMVEIYPPSATTELIHYIYWTLPSALVMATTLPLQIDDNMLKEGVMVDVYRWAKVKAIEKGNVEAAGFYGNWEERQRTQWKRSIKDAQRTDRGVDDTTLILQLGKGGSLPGAVRTARDHIVAGWTGLG